MNSFIKGLKNYVNFSGRTTRKDYWLYILFYFILVIVGTVFDNLFGLADPMTGSGPFATIIQLGLLIPTVAVEIRRNHDANRSGWFILLPFYNIYLLFVPTHPEENDWGPVPASITESTQNNGYKKNTSDLEAKLEEVKNLLEKGLLTEEEASTRRKKIISD